MANYLKGAALIVLSPLFGLVVAMSVAFLGGFIIYEQVADKESEEDL